MIIEVIMPVLGMSQDTGTLLKWFKKEGDRVIKGEPLMEVETDKATVEIEAPASGILSDVKTREGEVIPVAQVMAVILEEGKEEYRNSGKQVSEISKPVKEKQLEPTSPNTRSSNPIERQPMPSYIDASPLAVRIAASNNIDLHLVRPKGSRIEREDVIQYLEMHQDKNLSESKLQRIPASPKARRLAAERQVNLDKIKGSGPQEAITAEDVVNFTQTVSPLENISQENLSPGVGSNNNKPLPKIWRAMAEHTSRSWKSVPHFYLLRDVNASQLIEWRKSAQIHGLEKITFTDLLVKISGLALVQNKWMNAIWIDGNISYVDNIAVSVAMAIEDGLVAPVIHRANQLGINEIALRRIELYERARLGKLRQDDLEGGTFTISNLGMYGIDSFYAILNTPQAALLAVGRISDRVVALNGHPSVQPMMTLTLSCDHRVIDGVHGAQFLSTITQFIESPLDLLT